MIEAGITRASFQEIRRTVEDMLEIIEQPASTADDRERACSTIRSALSGGTCSNRSEENSANNDLSDAPTAAADHHAAVLDSLEAEFAERLREVMNARSMTQAELAARIGCTQPAISQMLKRQCRPQKNTILKLASALNVDPRELWRDLEVTDILDAVAAVQEEQAMSEAEADSLRRALERPAANVRAAPLPKRKQ